MKQLAVFIRRLAHAVAGDSSPDGGRDLNDGKEEVGVLYASWRTRWMGIKEGNIRYNKTMQVIIHNTNAQHNAVIQNLKAVGCERREHPYSLLMKNLPKPVRLLAQETVGVFIAGDSSVRRCKALPTAVGIANTSYTSE